MSRLDEAIHCTEASSVVSLHQPCSFKLYIPPVALSKVTMTGMRILVNRGSISEQTPPCNAFLDPP